MEELVDTLVDVKDQDGVDTGKVVGCDFDFGVTIIDAEDPSMYLFCIAGPSSSLWGIEYSNNIELYRGIFVEVLNGIISGLLDLDNLNKYCKEQGGTGADMLNAAGLEYCPFGQ